jgi:ATP-binding cassette, subfamily B, vacuolar membrane transporter HMT1/ACLQ
VVPQKDLLFCDTIKNNLIYPNMGATDEEMKTACKSAAIHEKIMTFPDGGTPLHFNVQQSVC